MSGINETNYQPDLNAAQQWIATIRNCSLDQVFVQNTFFTCIHPEQDEALKKYLPRNYPGYLSHVSGQLFKDSKAGYGIYAAPNEVTGARRIKEAVTKVFTLWADLDDKDAKVIWSPDLIHELPLKPTMVVSTGGGHHLYWCLVAALESNEHEVKVRVENLLRGIRASLERFGADKKVLDCSRVLRVPGFFNTKADRKMAQTRIIYSDGPRHTLEELETAFPPVPDPNTRNFTTTPVLDSDINHVDQQERDSLGIEWLRECPPSIQGQGGDAALHSAALGLAYLGIGETRGAQLLEGYFNPRCSPPWGASKLEYEISRTCAYTRERGQFGYRLLTLDLQAVTGPLATTLTFGPSNNEATVELPPGEHVAIPSDPTIQRRYIEGAGNMALITRKKVTKKEKDPITGEENEVDEYEVRCLSMCDFIATITQENIIHEGDGTYSQYWIDALTAGGKPLPTLKVKADEFPSMKWLDQWGADISIAQSWPRAHGSVTGNIKEALVERKKVFPPSHCEVWDHLGWRDIRGTITYLHAKGGITADGLVPSLTVDTKQPSLKNYGFDKIHEGDDLRQAIRASLSILDLGGSAEHPMGGDVATIPVYLATFRSTLPTLPKWGCHTHAGTGKGKSTLIALLQGHFDVGATDTTLAGSWLSTPAALETLVHAAKNCVVPIDDASQSVDKIDQKMDRIFRSSGNGTSRQRMRSTMEAMRSFPPRGMVLSTGEDLPAGHSCRARVMLISTPAIVHPQGDNSLLDKLQQDVREGVMTGAMAAWLQWLAPQVKEIEKDWSKILISQRKSMDLQLIAQHGRSVDQVAELLITGRLVLSWAVAQQAITPEESNAYMARFIMAFMALSEDQKVEQNAENPVTKFFNLLPDLMAAGNCHFLDADSNDLSGAPRSHQNEFGWSYSGSGELGGWKPRGVCVGKLKGNLIYLNQTAAHSVVVEYAKRSGTSFAMTGQMFWKSMKPFLVKGDGRNLGKKMSSKLAEGMESTHAPCLLITSFPDWEGLPIPTTKEGLKETLGNQMGGSGGQFEGVGPIPNFSAFPSGVGTLQPPK